MVSHYSLSIIIPFLLGSVFEAFPLRLAKTMDDLKEGVVKITDMVDKQHGIGTDLIMRIEDKTANFVVEQGFRQADSLVSTGSREPNGMPVALSREITGKDGGPMVLVPAGSFLMGSPEGTGEPDERPQHRVYLNDFYIDQYEVTVERYHQFLQDNNRGAPKYWDRVEISRDGQKPVVRITWYDAQAYCQWAGKRLPTEAEWEKAARGPDNRTYPWGETTPNFTTANLGKAYEPGKAYAEKLQPVGSFERGKSLYGAYDMAGNVWEWVADWFDQDYYLISPKKNPQGPSSGNFKVRRGGSWGNDPTALRSGLRGRLLPLRRSAAVGFRCAQDAP
ncbi:MAG: formylglycine-generating enzyme family protein [Nitrospirales bacterium]